MTELKADPSQKLSHAAKKSAGCFVALGVFTILLGLFAISSPLYAGVAVQYFVGASILLGGIFQLAHAFSGGGGNKPLPVFAFLSGLLAVLCGGVMFAKPLLGLKVLTLILIGYFIADGLVKTMYALKHRPESGWGWVLLSGIVTLLLGILLWRDWPLSGAWAIGVLFGINLIFDGWAMIFTGSTTRKVLKAMESAAKSRGVSNVLLLGIALTSLFSLTACDSGSVENWENPDEDAKIFASNYPLSYFAKRITGRPEKIYFPEIEGDPAFWEPNAEDIVKIQQCNPLLFNGATYEKWRKTVTLPKKRIVNTTTEFTDHYIEVADAVTHQHGPDGHHSHGGTAFTTWIDFSQAEKQALAISKSLKALRPEISTEVIEANSSALVKDLQGLDEDMKQLCSSKPGIKLVASHPIYQYLARAYQLDIQSRPWEPDVMPDERQWNALEQLLIRHPAKWMIWEGEPLEESVQRLKKLGVESIVFDPCANTPDTGDFLSVMRQNIENLRPVFRTAP